MTAYATRSDVYRYGLPRGTLGSTGREAASVLAATDTFELEEHGFETGDELVVRALQGGSLPGGLSASTTYYAKRVTADTFQLSSTPSGPTIDLTTDGQNVLVASPLPFDEVLEFYSRFVDTCVPAHAAPFEAPYPVLIVATVATLAAKRLQNISGTASNIMSELERGARDMLKDFQAGKPLADPLATTPTNLAITGEASTTDPRGWGTETLP